MINRKHKHINEIERDKDILAKVFLKLAYYRHYNGLYPSKTREEINGYFKNDPKSILVSKKMINTEGWVFTDHIEAKECPYGSPAQKRYGYLNDKHIENGVLTYYVKKPGKTSRRLFKKTMWRLRRDNSTRNNLREWFKQYADTIDNDRFLASPYYNLTAPKTNRYQDNIQWFIQEAWYLQKVLEYKDKHGSLLKDKDVMKATLKVLNELRSMIKESKEYRETDSYVDIEDSAVDIIMLKTSAKIILNKPRYKKKTIRRKVER